jgi:hypothetical protein
MRDRRNGAADDDAETSDDGARGENPVPGDHDGSP